MIATSKSGAERGRQRRSFSPQPVSFNLKGKVKLFQKLLLLRFGLDPPGIRKFSFLLVMCLKMRLELFLFARIGWEKQKKKRGRDEKSFTDVMQAGIQNVTHERDLAKIIIPACTTSSNWVTNRRTMHSLLSFRHSWRQPLYYSRVWQLVGLLCIWMAYLREAWLSVAVACNVSNASLSAARGIYHRRCVCPHDRKQYAPSLTNWPGQYELNFLERLSAPIITKGWNIVCQRTRLALF